MKFIIKNFFYLTILLSIISVRGSHKKNNYCEQKAIEVYNKIIESIGNNFPAPPTLQFSDKKRAVAYLSKNNIVIERALLDIFCKDENFENKVGYVIAHELAHHYLNHTWMKSSGLAYIESYSSSYEQRKIAEIQADTFAGFFGQIAGYNVLGNAKSTLTQIYENYNLPPEINGYPSLNERIQIIESKIDEANNLSKIFILGTVLIELGKYDTAKKCFQEILDSRFTSREIYNNIGLAYMLKGIKESDLLISRFVYPISLDKQTRADISVTRSTNFFTDPDKEFEMAKSNFEKAIALDSNYKKAKKNLIILGFIESIKNKKTKSFIESNDFKNLDSVSKQDLIVIHQIIEGKKVNKIFKKLTYNSNISITNLGLNKDVIHEDVKELIQRFDINTSDIFLGGSNFKRIRSKNNNIKIYFKSYSKYDLYKIDDINLISSIENISTENSTINRGLSYFVFE